MQSKLPSIICLLPDQTEDLHLFEEIWTRAFPVKKPKTYICQCNLLLSKIDSFFLSYITEQRNNF